MGSFLDRFRSRANARAPLVCYLRENGPIAYGLDLFGRDPRERADAMLSTPIAWYWKATAGAEVARDWTQLTRWSLAALLGDFTAEHNGLTPHVLLVGVDAQDAPDEMADARVASLMRAFGGGADAPLHAIITRPAPGGDLVFVAQQPPESVRGLLQAWGINRDKAERRAYARLQTNSLEDLAKTLGR